MATPNHPMLTIEKSRELVEGTLAIEFAEMSTEANEIHPRYARFINSLRSLGEKGGKRLRPHLAMLAFEAYSGKPGEGILPAAVSLELLHLAMLIHDDVIDRDTVRYGQPNVTGAQMEHYANTNLSDVDKRHFADGSAILAGDLLQSHAYYMFEQTDSAPGPKQEARKIMRQTTASVVAGELLDVEVSFDDTGDVDMRTIALHKTASYTFVSPLLVGATFAEATADEKSALRSIGEDIGVAFQYQDDILGTFGNPKVTGKRNDGDIKEGKRTALTEAFYRRAPEYRHGEFAEIWGNNQASAKEIQFARQLLQVYARPIVEGQLRIASTRINDRLAELSIPPEYRKALKDLATHSVRRKS